MARKTKESAAPEPRTTSTSRPMRPALPFLLLFFAANCSTTRKTLSFRPIMLHREGLN
jgi:hypothetical protein